MVYVFVVCSWCICHVFLHACAPYGKIQGNELGKLSYLCRRVHTNGHVNWAADHIATCSHSKLIILFLFHHLYILPVVGYHGITLTKDLCLTLRYSFPFHPLLGRQQDRRAKGLAPTKSKLVGLLHCPVCSCGTCNNLDSMSFCLKRHNLPAKERVPHQTLSLYRCQTTCHKTYQIYQMNVSE